LRPYSCRMTTVRKVNYDKLDDEALPSVVEENASASMLAEQERPEQEEEEDANKEEGEDDMEVSGEGVAEKEKGKNGKRKREAARNGKGHKARLPFTTEQVLLTQPVPDIRGHTSFLTFAKKNVS